MMVMMTNLISVSFATSLDDLKKQQKNTKSQIQDKKKEIQDIKTEERNVSLEIQELDKKLNQATEELNSVVKEIEKLTSQISQTEEELVETEKDLEEKNDTFNSRLRVMYKTRNTGYLEVLLTSASIKDFFSKQQMIKSIAEHDVELINYIKEKKQEIEIKKSKLEEDKANIELSKVKLEARRNDLNKATRAKEDLMAKLQENIKLAESEYDKLNKEAKELETKIIQSTVRTGAYTGGVMMWPVQGYTRISSPYGYRIHPIFKTRKLHTGIDIPAPTGTNIFAAEEGTVIHTGSLGGYGQTVMIDHGGGIVTLYAHNSSITVSKGQDVSKGSVIAKAGSTGYSTGPHLHFEVRKNGSYVDPLPWVRGK